MSLIVVCLISLVLSLLNPASAWGQGSNIAGSAKTEVNAQVGDFLLNLSGIASPFASVVGTSQNVFLKSGVADKNGNFDLSGILIRMGFSTFCIEVIDFERIGSSTTCFTIPPAKSTVNMNNLFLPPTLGLFRTQIEAGKSAIAFGYTVPGARVTLHFDKDRTLTATAAASGYYKFEVGNVRAGTYQLYSKGTYQEKESLTPTKKVELKAVPKKLGFFAAILEFLKKLWQFFTSLALGPLWTAIPILIFIIILVILILKLLKKRKRLHHWWFIGF